MIGSEIHIDIFDDRTEIYSPGGMPDGTFIQDRDPLTVPSNRRNPLLANIFERLGYMERRGSGFGKIIRSYENQVNYKEGKRPHFRSDRTQFTVILPNLNYEETEGVRQDVRQGVRQDVRQDVRQGVRQDDIDSSILELIRRNNKISIRGIAQKNLSARKPFGGT